MANYRGVRKQLKFLKRGLILCEGETEANYFNGLITKEEYRRKFASISVEIYKPKDHSPKGLVTEAKQKTRNAKRKENPYDFIWVVFDRDGHENLPAAFNEAVTFTPAIKIAFTATCFEFYVLLHFKKSTRAYTSCDDVISELKKVFPEYKKATNLFATLEEKMSVGLENSKWCHEHFKEEIIAGKKVYTCDPYCNVHELVNYLLDLIKD